MLQELSLLGKLPRDPPAHASGRSLLAAGRRLVLADRRGATENLRRVRRSPAACRQYEQLRSSGLPHDAALRHSLGVSSAQRSCGTTRPLMIFCRTGVGSPGSGRASLTSGGDAAFGPPMGNAISPRGDMPKHRVPLGQAEDAPCRQSTRSPSTSSRAWSARRIVLSWSTFAPRTISRPIPG